METNVLDLALFTMVSDSNFDYDYNSEVYTINQDDLKEVISEEFYNYLRSVWFIASLHYYGLSFVDAYYINWADTNTWNWIFWIWLSLNDKDKLVNTILDKQDIVNHYIRAIRAPNSDDENTIDEIINSIDNWNLPQCLAYIFKKDFSMVGREIIANINKEIEYEELLILNNEVSADINYLQRLDYLENFSRHGLKLEWEINGHNDIKYYYFSRQWKESFFYKLEIVPLATENNVEIEYVEE